MAHWVTFCDKGSKLTPNYGAGFRNSSSFSEEPQNITFCYLQSLQQAQEREQPEKEGSTRALGRSAPLLTHRLLEGSVKTSGEFL